jgi:CubicO group peptidase (beta-lactamase class C family)
VTEKKIKKELEPYIGKVTPGLMVQAFHKGDKRVDIKLGEVYPYYDLASLTKVIFTTTLFMNLYGKQPRILEDKVLKYLSWFFHPSLSVRQLLTHTSGLSWWKPLYQSLNMAQPREERWEALKQIIAEEKLEVVNKAVYSDLDFLMLGYILETQYEKPLSELWKMVQDEFELPHIHFNIDNKPTFDKKKYAPTEECKWRGARLQGQVHDENTFALGGVAPHSGLFGPIEEVSKWILALREIFYGNENKKSNFITSDTAQTFFQRAIAQNIGDFALGFMIKSAKDSTAGNLFSKNTIGHTGYTGTSTWFDLDNDLIVNVVSNRVFYGRDNAEQMKQLRVVIHDACYREIIGVGS